MAVVLTFSEPVTFGTGSIVLRNVTAGADIEAFDVVTETGPGPGKCQLSGSTITLTPTAQLPASAEISVRIPGTAVRDAAANPLAAILSFEMALRWSLGRPADADRLFAAVGAAPVEINPAEAAASPKTNAEVWEEFMTMKDAAKKQAFYNANRGAIIAHLGIK